jgi:hypothetical protein
MIHPFDHNEVAVLNMVVVSSAVACFDIGQTRRLGQSSQVLKLDHIALIQARYRCALHPLVALLNLFNEHDHTWYGCSVAFLGLGHGTSPQH